MKYRSAAVTHIGKIPVNNEDNFYRNKDTVTYSVCDGMGGEEFGEIASQIAVDTIRAFDDGSIGNNVDEVVKASNDKIKAECNARGCTTMGSTMALLTIDQDIAAAWNVGDSRVYLLRGGKLQQLTEDHTMVYQMYLNGALTKEEVRTHKRGNILYQHLGMQDDLGDPKASQAEPVKVKKGDVFLLCSDGLTDMVPDEEIERILGEHDEVRPAAKDLVNAALEAGGKDNVTVIVVKAFRRGLLG